MIISNGVKNFADKLLEATEKMKNPSCIGLDPRIEDIPDFLKGGDITETFFDFNKMIIDATYDIVPAFKVQIAFYEKYKVEGIKAFEKTINYLKKKNKIVIVDAKRNDIGPTAEAYSSAYLSPEGFDVDALTANPYFGIDGLKPFIDDAIKYGKGIFVLVKTSNPSSREFQDQTLKSGKKLYELIGEKVNEWGKNTKGETGYQIVGTIVGATYPKELKSLRKVMPQSIFLVPGYGAQGGTIKDIIFAFNKDGEGAIVNNSRGIIFAWKNESYSKRFRPREFHLAAREAALAMKKELLSALSN
ncbi:MAG: Orotidine 5'-phosphate decarboxylase [Syntrophomonadaceae bacterium]|nr:Orotidine 5'-phosphate decarboxylase [Bacillota bacterium]